MLNKEFKLEAINLAWGQKHRDWNQEHWFLVTDSVKIFVQ